MVKGCYMPVKILLADKSITIQKVVEMLFSGREYEVSCASDGETALNEAGRTLPDVVLADVDLPRIDGYSFSERLKQVPALAQTPVILMLSRDDVFDEAKAKQAGIVDSIAKPFESQDLISKVRKAISAAPPRAAEAAGAAAKPTAVTKPAPAAAPSQAHQAQKPKQAAPTDIFDIIEEAPSPVDLRPGAAAPGAEEESVFEVEPEFEAEEQQAIDGEEALPVGKKAVEEMRAGLGLSGGAEQAEPKAGSVDSLGLAAVAALDTFEKPAPRRPETPKPRMPEAREYVPPVRFEPATEAPSVAVSEDMLRNMAQETVTRMAKEVFAKLPPVQPPPVSEEMLRKILEESVTKIVRETARQVIEKVAWEVIPDLAEMLIKAEIERLKKET
jgi:CheY-like chemotaxis protein